VKKPKHIGIIMDGNGRWAQARKHKRLFGHVRGAQVAKTIIEGCSRREIKHLTLFAFSTENWFRLKDEVNFLMKLLSHHLNREQESLIKNNIQFRCIGHIEQLPEHVYNTVLHTIQETSHCTGMILTFALSYGGRQEIVDATRSIATLVHEGKIKPEDITNDVFSAHLESSFLPNPDLIIRTSGEFRLSNFYLWSAAYSELLIIEKMWPDFSLVDLDAAIQEFGERERRFGKINEQLHIPYPESSKTISRI